MKAAGIPIMAERREGVLTLTLSRPEKRNALNLEMIQGIRRHLESLGEDCRLVVIRAHGADFSAGADLEWMRDGFGQDVEILRKESLALAEMYRSIRESRVPVLTLVQGRALGGAMGILGASDLVLAREDAAFGFPEIKLGLIPATIAPYVLKKMGYGRTLELMLTGRSFDAETARSAGLVQEVCPGDRWEARAEALKQELCAHPPEAMRAIRELLRDPLLGEFSPRMDQRTSELIAHFRTTPEAQARMAAFLEVRRPSAERQQ